MESIYGKVPLDRDCRNIRLIKLLRNGPDAPISCRFCTTKLSSPKLYKAVSYTWGDPASTRSILLDGETFAIRENLWNFLNQERQVQHPSYLWIDAICIDQTNDIERGYQVALMREIYSKAFKVTVWLGPSTEDTRSHLLHLQYLSKFSKTIELHSWEPDFTDFVLELCRRPYWHRVWIVQEFVLATEIDICCGYQKIEGRALGWLFKVLRKEARGDWGSRVLVRELWQTPAMQILQQRAGCGLTRHADFLLQRF
ncbi:HET-domain-containing protein [Lentithecium fluviatile CBS 122367]|uniref:HET-domain-containing protein n=1 Tax=Lentithecium fluviatile CBS 122367 TaxID=1168545 RepID=A0A6G1IMN8_9PLEO|nr:HET-domain-containing protein [Lentithecium fluviatile CBS 122367]